MLTPEQRLERKRERNRRYYHENKERMKQYYLNNKEKYKEYCKNNKERRNKQALKEQKFIRELYSLYKQGEIEVDDNLLPDNSLNLRNRKIYQLDCKIGNKNFIKLNKKEIVLKLIEMYNNKEIVLNGETKKLKELSKKEKNIKIIKILYRKYKENPNIIK